MAVMLVANQFTDPCYIKFDFQLSISKQLNDKY